MSLSTQSGEATGSKHNLDDDVDIPSTRIDEGYMDT